jgi:hypothetical protein
MPRSKAQGALALKSYQMIVLAVIRVPRTTAQISSEKFIKNLLMVIRPINGVPFP